MGLGYYLGIIIVRGAVIYGGRVLAIGEHIMHEESWYLGVLCIKGVLSVWNSPIVFEEEY